MSEVWVQILAIIGSNFLIMLTFFGTTIALHIQTNKKIDAIQEEMKDFHGRLCKIEESKIKLYQK